MAALSEDNIVALTLLNVLDPSAEQLSACAPKATARARRRRLGINPPLAKEARCTASKPSRIRVVERLSSRMITVSWSDPCSGRYTEQIWCSGLADVAAVCVLTGHFIQQGDDVYRPRWRARRVPINRHQMIHAAAARQRLAANTHPPLQDDPR